MGLGYGVTAEITELSLKLSEKSVSKFLEKMNVITNVRITVITLILVLILI